MKNMKLRYYLRGLGIGVLVTAFIMGISGKGGNTMTDAQIRERALELGMVDGSSLVLSDLRNTTGDAEQENAENNTDVSKTEPSAVPENPADMQETEPEETDAAGNAEETDIQGTDVEGAEGEGVEDSQEAEQPGEAPDGEISGETPDEAIRDGSRVENGIAYFEIIYGENSNSVSRDLSELGLVADAEAFDNYLCTIGYSKNIHAGNYAIAVGTSEEEIAKIITGNR